MVRDHICLSWTLALSEPATRSCHRLQHRMLLSLACCLALGWVPSLVLESFENAAESLEHVDGRTANPYHPNPNCVLAGLDPTTSGLQLSPASYYRHTPRSSYDRDPRSQMTQKLLELLSIPPSHCAI